MNKKLRFVQIGTAMALAAVLSASAGAVILAAIGLPGQIPPVITAAAAVSLLCAVCAWSPAGCMLGAAGLLALAGWFLLGHKSGFGPLGQWLKYLFGALTDPPADAAVPAAALAMPVLTGLGALLDFVLIYNPGGSMFVLIGHFGILMGCYALTEALPLIWALPGTVAAVAVFALSSKLPRDRGVWRPLASALIVAVLAFMLVPGGRPTWAPLEDAAGALRNLVEDYFHFTQERMPFTITTEGYNHASTQDDGTLIARLGGPADPSKEPMLRVRSDRDVLLRGTIRRTYTGYSWVDIDPRARYLYYDPTRRAERAQALGMEANDAFDEVHLSVEFLKSGTGTLFVPGRLHRFTMRLQNAVYYNSIGEMFLSRATEAGDAYAADGYVPKNDQSLHVLIRSASNQEDAAYDEASETCLQLPDGIESGVYALVADLTQGCDDDYEKAQAIQNWLQSHCRYTLTPALPRYDRDFVSQFVLDDRAGYCSYFASAMTVMCRIAGLPSRYVEGYTVRVGSEEIVTLTGENAHAWTEVCFKNVGWIAFDPSGGGAAAGQSEAQPPEDQSDDRPGDASPDQTDGENGDGDSDGSSVSEPEGQSPEGSPQNHEDGSFQSETSPVETPEPDDGQSNGQSPQNDTPPDGAQPTPPEDPPPEPDEADTQPPPKGRVLAWLFFLILLLLAAGIVWLVRRVKRTDPAQMARQAQDPRDGIMIVYRAILTLLCRDGKVPFPEETPGAFARRISEGTQGARFVAFADGVSTVAYGRNDVDRALIDAGCAVYAEVLERMSKPKRLTALLHRALFGNGNWHMIP